jgi:hypothetical protein
MAAAAESSPPFLFYSPRMRGNSAPNFASVRENVWIRVTLIQAGGSTPHASSWIACVAVLEIESDL